MRVKPKFDECRSCRFFSRLHTNPNCGACDNGEFFEEKTCSRALTDNELMDLYKETYDE